MSTPDPNAFSLDINDPEDAELIEYFLEELPEKIAAINTAQSEENIEELGRIAHQLKGAAPGFGFPAIGSAAGDLEGRIRALDESEQDLQRVQSDIESLLSLCQSYITKKP
jgi:histidine phosphotransfer protein HptB